MGVSSIISTVINYKNTQQIYLVFSITSTTLSFMYAVFVILSNPSFIKMNECLFEIEKGFCSLYLTSSAFIDDRREPSSLADIFYTRGPYRYSLRKHYVNVLSNKTKNLLHILLGKIIKIPSAKEEETFSQLFMREAKNEMLHN